MLPDSRPLFLSLIVLSVSSPNAPARASDDAEPPTQVTYSEHIAPLLFQRCAECHRPGQAAPFPLLSYADARKHGPMMVRVVDDRIMPPWHPDPSWEPLRDARVLTDAEIALIDRWVEQGSPEGDPSKTPPVPDFPVGWSLGTPDLVLTMKEPFQVPASGPDINRCFVLPLDLPADKWVRAVEIRPSSKGVLHHALFFLGSSADVRARDGKDGQPGFPRMGAGTRGMLGGWALGATPRFLPDDLAMPMPSGTDFVLQLHFHPSGKAQPEATTVGLYLSDDPPSRMIQYLQLPPLFGARQLGFPRREKPLKAGTTWTIHDSRTLDREVELLTVGGHAHYLCTSMQAVATLPDGSVRNLFRIADWDFNWQGRYDYEKPIRLPAGTRIDVEITYDNTESNPRNPSHPPVDVGFGESSTDEMGAITFTYIDPNAPPGAASGRLAGLGRRLGESLRQSLVQNADGDPARLSKLLMRLDADKDGGLSRQEAPPRILQAFEIFDDDGDDRLSPDEIETTIRRLRESLGGQDTPAPKPAEGPG